MTQFMGFLQWYDADKRTLDAIRIKTIAFALHDDKDVRWIPSAMQQLNTLYSKYNFPNGEYQYFIGTRAEKLAALQRNAGIDPEELAKAHHKQLQDLRVAVHQAMVEMERQSNAMHYHIDRAIVCLNELRRMESSIETGKFHEK